MEGAIENGVENDKRPVLIEERQPDSTGMLSGLLLEVSPRKPSRSTKFTTAISYRIP